MLPIPFDRTCLVTTRVSSAELLARTVLDADADAICHIAVLGRLFPGSGLIISLLDTRANEFSVGHQSIGRNLGGADARLSLSELAFKPKGPEESILNCCRIS